mmetsp:Transcript_10168/g.25785  ORF Transcript_10168/g.25785 Transcript_10168/m.25785 type:complete len:158 (+) Transcript_10168:255-728(+)
MARSGAGSTEAEMLIAALGEEGQQAAAIAELRMEHLREAHALQLRREREERELKALQAKMQHNKDVLNELRFGAVGDAIRDGAGGGAGLLGDQYWVASGSLFFSMPGKQAQALIARNQMQCAKLQEQSKEALSELDSALNDHVNELNLIYTRGHPSE